MSRVQLALNVDDLDEAITFYTKLFGVDPAKVKPGYANFAVAEPPLKLVLLENHAGLTAMGLQGRAALNRPDAIHIDLTGAWLVEQIKTAQEGGFAGTGWADDYDELALLNIEGNSIRSVNGDFPHLVPFVNRIELNKAHAFYPVS